MKSLLLVMSAPLMVIGTAHAQAAPPVQQQAPSAQSPGAEVADAEVSRFALAALVIEQIAADKTIPKDQQQQAMAGAIQKIGLQPQRFNQIAQASQGDTELQQRIQAAAQQHIDTAKQAQPAQ